MMSEAPENYVMPSFEEMFSVNFTEEDIEALREALADMKGVVKVEAYLSKDPSCYTCTQTLKFLELLRENSPLIGDRKAIDLAVYFVEDHREEFLRKNVVRVPTIRLLDGYITYLGMPAGEEMKAFVETVIRLSSGEHGLSDSTVKLIQNLERDVVVEVIVTPLCPYCPYAALMVNMMAYVSRVYGNSKLRSIIVEAYENPDIADRYGVTTVPTIAVNGYVVFVGPPHEFQLADAIAKISRL